MRAGKLVSVINIQRLIETKNSHHAVVEAWTTIGTMRAEVVRNAIAESETGFGEASTAGVNFRTRYRAGITTADRIRHRGRIHSIVGIIDNGIRGGLEIRAEAIE